MKITLSLSLLVSSAALADDGAVIACRTLADTASRLACYDAMPLAGAAARPALAVPPEQNFGLQAAGQKKKEAQPDTIRSTALGELSGWSPGARIALANGQVWRVVDGEAALPRMSSPKVEVARGLLGSFFLQVPGHTSAARVVRVQ
ncbi:hypothetical protein ACFPOU_23505 [Massilia jejuensis]|uniref:Uncharacterized protein n=1 Tax=Massilia jejuensis TaxID=648894 RepID=A0ABW0PNI7_9BURK